MIDCLFFLFFFHFLSFFSFLYKVLDFLLLFLSILSWFRGIDLFDTLHWVVVLVTAAVRIVS